MAGGNVLVTCIDVLTPLVLETCSAFLIPCRSSLYTPIPTAWFTTLTCH